MANKSLFQSIRGMPAPKADAVNEAGSTKQEEPAPATDEADAKDAEPATGPAAGLEAIEDAERLTGATDDAP